jgi:hypothetical protein
VPSLADADSKVLFTQSREILEFADKYGDNPLGAPGADPALVKSWVDKVAE